MPKICRFYGIVIKMYFDDHNPPHFHAEYSGHEALIDVNTLGVFSGGLPARGQALVTVGRLSIRRNFALIAEEPNPGSPWKRESLFPKNDPTFAKSNTSH